MQFESIGEHLRIRHRAAPFRRRTHQPGCAGRAIPPARLVQALDSRFVGVGDADNTVVCRHPRRIHDPRQTLSHVQPHLHAGDRRNRWRVFTKQHLRRMQYLRRKLIDDLTEGDKIFVYKSINGLSDDEARAIYRAILGYGGKQALLCVRLEDQAHPRGTLERYENGTVHRLYRPLFHRGHQRRYLGRAVPKGAGGMEGDPWKRDAPARTDLEDGWSGVLRSHQGVWGTASPDCF